MYFNFFLKSSVSIYANKVYDSSKKPEFEIEYKVINDLIENIIFSVGN